MRVIGNAALPPCVDTSGNNSHDFWMSPAISWLPDSEMEVTKHYDAFKGLAMTASLLGKGKRKSVEMRLECRKFVLTPDGTAEPLDVGHALARESVGLHEFLEKTEVAPGRRAMSHIFTFYEDGIDLITASVAGGIPYDSQIVVNVCRGYNKPERMSAGQNYANMTFMFDEGARSFERWRDRLKESV